MHDSTARPIRLTRSFTAGEPRQIATEAVLESVRVARFTVAAPVVVRMANTADGGHILLPVGSFFDVPATALEGAVHVEDLPQGLIVQSQVWLIDGNGHEVAWARMP